MIPKILHLIWLGGDPLPAAYQANRDEFERLHPEWHIYEWTDINLPDLACDYEFHMTENQSARSDVLRIEMLYRFGGVYMDRDVRVLRSINGLLDKDFICSTGAGGGTFFSSSVMGMTVGSSFASDLWRMLPGWCLSRQLDIPRTNVIASPLVTELWHKRYRRSTDVATMPKAAFFPLNRGDAIPEQVSADEFPDSYAVHSWDGTWK